MSSAHAITAAILLATRTRAFSKNKHVLELDHFLSFLRVKTTNCSHSPREDGAHDADDPLGLRRDGAGLAAAAAATGRREGDLGHQQEGGGADPQPERRVQRADADVSTLQYTLRA
jgi:hypothetical protein